MHPKPKPVSWRNDCFLAAFALAVSSVSLALFARLFSWQALLALLIVPVLLLCCHERYRAAAISAGAALLAGVLLIIPPRWSFRLDADGALAIVVFAAAAGLAITLAIRESQRKPSAPPTGSQA